MKKKLLGVTIMLCVLALCVGTIGFEPFGNPPNSEYSFNGGPGGGPRPAPSRPIHDPPSGWLGGFW